MQSANFEFLRKNQAVLADLGAFAEHYVQTDPQSSLIKLRVFGEQLGGAFYHHFKIPRLPGSSLVHFNYAEGSGFPVALAKWYAITVHEQKGDIKD